MYGAQTAIASAINAGTFENDVEMYGAQTSKITHGKYDQFENDVEMYGAQTISELFTTATCLRMM